MARTPSPPSERDSPSPPPVPSPRTKGKKKGTKRKAPNKTSQGSSRQTKKQKDTPLSPPTSKRAVAPPPRAPSSAAGVSKSVPTARKRRSEQVAPTIQLSSSSSEAQESESGESSPLKENFEGNAEDNFGDKDVTMADLKAQTPDPLDVVGLSTSQPQPEDPPLDLQGSSRTTGGFARGKAAGNTPNMADFPDIHESSTSTIPIPSYIYFYFTNENPAGFSITQVKAGFKASMPKHSTLEDIVQRLRLQYPGLDGMYFILLLNILLINCFLASSASIYAWSDDMWESFGSVTNIISGDLPWRLSGNIWELHFLSVCLSFLLLYNHTHIIILVNT
jgi:hypothetical protein